MGATAAPTAAPTYADFIFTQQVTWSGLSVATYTPSVQDAFEAAYAAAVGVMNLEGVRVSSTVANARRAATVTYSVSVSGEAAEKESTKETIDGGQSAVASNPANLQSKTKSQLASGSGSGSGSGAGSLLASGPVTAQPASMAPGGPPPASSSSGVSGGAIAGIVIGCIIGVAVLVGILY